MSLELRNVEKKIGQETHIYETNLMRRLSGLLYLDTKVVGDIKEKIKLKQ